MPHVTSFGPRFSSIGRDLGQAVESVSEAARGGARLIVFPGPSCPAPAWIWRPPKSGDMALARLHSLREGLGSASQATTPRRCWSAKQNKVASSAE
jgi:hypothetical protein